MTYVVKSVTSNQYKVNVVNQNGALLPSQVAAPTVVTSAISDVSSFATTAAMLANDATTYANSVAHANAVAFSAYANAVAYVDGRSFVNTSSLAIDLAGYQTISGLSFAVSTLQSNSATFLGGATITTIDNRITSNASAAYVNAVAYVDTRPFVNTSQLSSSLANYQTTAGLAANVAILTANNANNLGGLPASSYVNTSQLSSNLALYQTSAGLSANVAILTANNANNLGGIAAASYVNTSQLSSNLASYQTTAGLSANVATLTANNANNLGGAAAASYVNTAGAYTITGIHTHNANIVFGSSATIIANGGFGTSGQVLTSNGTGMHWSTVSGGGGSVNVAAQYVWTNTQTFSNTITFSQVIIGTANNANNLGGLPASSYVNTSQLSSNLTNYQTTAGLAANVAILTANNANNFGGLSLATVQGQISGNASTAYTNAVNYVTAQNFVNTSQLSSNLSSYQTTLGLSANVLTLTANAAAFLGDSSGTISNISSWITGNSSAAYTNAITIASNATNLTSGTLPDARLSSAVVNTSGTQTLTNKRIDPRVSSTASASSVTPDISSFDMYVYTALAVGLTINATTGGTPVNGNKLVFRFKDDGTARALTWTTSGTDSFRAIGVTLPTTTTISKVTYVGCIYNSNESFWDVVAVTTQA